MMIWIHFCLFWIAYSLRIEGDSPWWFIQGQIYACVGFIPLCLYHLAQRKGVFLPVLWFLLVSLGLLGASHDLFVVALARWRLFLFEDGLSLLLPLFLTYTLANWCSSLKLIQSVHDFFKKNVP